MSHSRAYSISLKKYRRRQHRLFTEYFSLTLFFFSLQSIYFLSLFIIVRVEQFSIYLPDARGLLIIVKKTSLQSKCNKKLGDKNPHFELIVFSFLNLSSNFQKAFFVARSYLFNKVENCDNILNFKQIKDCFKNLASAQNVKEISRQLRRNIVFKGNFAGYCLKCKKYKSSPIGTIFENIKVNFEDIFYLFS